MEVTGKIYKIMDTEVINEKFKKRSLIVQEDNEYNGNTYTEYHKFEVVQDKVNILDDFKVGQIIKVSFNLRGRKYEKDGKEIFFTTLHIWRIEMITKIAAEGDVGDNDSLPF